MTLTKEQYAAFEDIVGPEYINDSPEVLYSYSWRSGLYAPPISFSPLFEAVLTENHFRNPENREVMQ
jgi:hypothetical protein